jgi:SAM-dependent methyltransferase
MALTDEIPAVVHDDLYDIDVPPVRYVSRVATGGLLARALYVACKLGLADLCGAQARTAEELAQQVGAHGPSLLRFLRVLAGAHLFAEDGSGRFHLTPLGTYLRVDVEGSVWPFVILSGEVLDPALSGPAMLHTARTGGAAFEHTVGCSVYEYLAAHPEDDALWERAMNNRAVHLAGGVLDGIDWTGVRHVVDVGGNQGAFLAAILERLPAVRGTLFDQPHVAARAAERFAAAGAAARVELVGGDFFEAVPAGGDLYLLANVLWNWPDERAATILRRCREAVPDHGRVVIFEPVVPAGNAPHPAKNLDLVNLLGFGGRTRSESEWRALLAEAGFTMTGVTTTPMDWALIEAVPQ